MRVAITGATGLIGRHLTAALVARGDEVVALSRSGAPLPGTLPVRWDPASEPWPAAAKGIDAIVNLAGEPIGPARWTADRRQRILQSRLSVTRAAAGACTDGITLVSASAVGYYGPTDAAVDESAAPGNDFLAQVCVEWERATAQATGRTVLARTGIVLARDGGAFAPLRRLAALGALGPLGGGRQWVPWIHVDDEVAGLLHCLDDGSCVGPVNLVAPNPVHQREFARTLASRLHRPGVLAAPGFAVRAVLGDAATMVLDGQRVVPRVLVASGFTFRFPTLDGAVSDLVG